MNLFSRKIALRYLFSKKGETFISAVSIFAVLGVALGVAVLNITMSIMSGFEDELHKKLVGSSHIYIGSVAGEVDDYNLVIKKLKTINEIKTASAYVQGQVMLTIGKRSQGLLIKGIGENSPVFDELKNIKKEIFFAESLDVQLPKLLVGEQLKRRLGLYERQKVALLSPQMVSGPVGLAPRYKSFQIADFYNSGSSGYEEAFLYTTLTDAQKFFRLQDTVTGIEISLFEPNQAHLIKKKIIDELRILGKFNFYVQDWTELNSGLWEAISLEKRAYFIVLLLLIVLASFSIVTTLIMIVLEKRKDIAVIRTFGASSKTVRNIFLYMGGGIGLVGTVLGLVLGLAGCWVLTTYGFPLPENVFPTDTLPVKVSFLNFIFVGIIAWIICFVATLYPAIRASKLEPCEILRYE